MTINNKSERNYRGKCLGWPVTSYSGGIADMRRVIHTQNFERSRMSLKRGSTQAKPFYQLVKYI